MWKLRCIDNNKTKEKIVKYSNIIGRSEVRSFFAENGYAMMDSQMESITYLRKGESLKFYFPNGIKRIEVESL